MSKALHRIGPPGEDGGDHAVAPGADRPRDRWNATRWQRLTYRRICEMHDLNALRRKIASVRQEVRNLTVMGMRPDLQPHQAELIRNLERSARAEVKGRQAHLDHVLKTQTQVR